MDRYNYLKKLYNMTTELKPIPEWYRRIKNNKANSRLFEYAISNPNCSIVKGLLYRNFNVPMNIEFKSITDIFKTVIKTLNSNSLCEKVKFSFNTAREGDPFINYCSIHNRSKNRENFYSSITRHPNAGVANNPLNQESINSMSIELDDFEASWRRSWTNISSTENCYSTCLNINLTSVLDNLENNDLDLSNTLDEVDELCKDVVSQSSPDIVEDEEHCSDYAEVDEEWDYEIRFNSRELFNSTIEILKQIRDSGNQYKISEIMAYFSENNATNINELIDKLSEAVENQL